MEIIFGAFVGVCVFLWVFIWAIKKQTAKNIQSSNENGSQESNSIKASIKSLEILNEDSTTQPAIIIGEPVENTKDKILSLTEFKPSEVSIQGLSHGNMDPPIPCQDAGKTGILSNGFHVIIISDGAGSSRYSDIASAMCVQNLFYHVEQVDFSSVELLPEDLAHTRLWWQEQTGLLFEKVRNALLEYAAKENIEIQDLACTLLLVIRTKWGFLSANIGDGRAGYSDGQPHALIVPLMVFTVGATVFLIKDEWHKAYRSYVHIMEKPENLKYFFASSDGCQDFLMDRSQKGPKTGIYDVLLGEDAYYDLNIPYEPFFDGLVASLNEVSTKEERDKRLFNLIKHGIYTIEGEESELKSISDPALDDDKTFIIYHK